MTAEVVDKEYCQARKPENRFKVETHKMNIFQKIKTNISLKKKEILLESSRCLPILYQMTTMPCLVLSISFKTSKMKTIFSGGRKSVEFIAGAGGHQVLPGEMSTTGEGWRAAVNLVQNFNQILTL